MAAVVGFFHYASTDTLILSFQVLMVNMGLVRLVILVRMELCVDTKWIWKCFLLGTSASVEKALQVHAVRAMSMSAVPTLAWADIAMIVSLLNQSNACRAVQLRIWWSNGIAQDATIIIACLYPAQNININANYFHRTTPLLTSPFIFFCELQH